ncbi:type II secretion system protein [bacterium]|nr:type II secretion system protein [bacterium]
MNSFLPPPYFFWKRSRQENFRSFSSSIKKFLNHCDSKNSGFTLAEVLITLVIIGVIAAITVPTLITKYQKEQTATKLKKIYSTYAQAINRANIDYGDISSWDLTGYTTEERTEKFAEKYLFPYVQVIKKCIPTSNECWSDTVYSPNGNIDNQFTNLLQTHTSAVLNDGSCIYLWAGGDSSHVWLITDINCQRKPNKIGRDIFNFLLRFEDTETTKSGYKPVGLHDIPMLTRDEIKENCSTTGVYCAALIAIDGWQIKDDYPW